MVENEKERKARAKVSHFPSESRALLRCMSQAITNAAKAEVGLDRSLMQSYPLIYQFYAELNESNATISRRMKDHLH